MNSDVDVLWFIDRWYFIFDQMPQVFVVVSIIAMMIGCSFGSFLFGTKTTGIIITCLVFVIMFTMIGIWLAMLSKNIPHGAEEERLVCKYLQEYILREEAARKGLV